MIKEIPRDYAAPGVRAHVPARTIALTVTIRTDSPAGARGAISCSGSLGTRARAAGRR
jgi:hypothetical protein